MRELVGGTLATGEGVFHPGSDSVISLSDEAPAVMETESEEEKVDTVSLAVSLAGVCQPICVGYLNSHCSTHSHCSTSGASP